MSDCKAVTTPDHVRRLLYTVSADESGILVRSVLRQHMHLSVTELRRIKWLPDGILLDGQRVTVRHAAVPGQTVSVRLSDTARRSGIAPVPGDLDIVWEDADLIILNKAPGIVVHPCLGHPNDTVGNFLLHYYDTCGEIADFHPVHRLDIGTSGLLVVAKHAYAQESLRRALHTEDFRREYLAVCEGVPEPVRGTVRAPIGRRDGSVIAYEVRPDGAPASTDYEVVRTGGSRSLVRLRLHTGRTHQIRLHMASIGHPLVGDYLYGSGPSPEIARPALHSWRLRLRHPVTGEVLVLSLPLPDDMERLLEPR